MEVIVFRLLAAIVVALSLATPGTTSVVALPHVASVSARAEPDRGSLASGPRKLPSNLTPSLKRATSIKPRSYSDGCHRTKGQTTVKTCIYGDRRGSRSVVLFGDSHAAMWLPALESIAARRGWKLYSVTKSACPVAKVAHRLSGHSTADCDAWRRNAQEFIAGIHPDLVIAASIERQGLAGQPSYAAWNAGMRLSLKTLIRHAHTVALMGETPRFKGPVPACLAKHRSDTRACDAPRSFALSARRMSDARATARAVGAIYVRLSDITCPARPCPSVVGHYMVSYDDHHMTPAWVKHLIPRLEPRLPLH